MWYKLYTSVATSREEVLCEKTLIEKEILLLSRDEHNSVKKLQGEIEVDCNKLCAVQDKYTNRGAMIQYLEQRFSALSIKPSNVVNLEKTFTLFISKNFACQGLPVVIVS